MKTYELLTMIRPNIDSEEVQNVVNKIGEAAEALGGKTVDTEMMGRKKLSYEIQNFRDAYMAVIRLELPAEQVAEFRRQLKLNDSILRMMFMEISKVRV